MVLWGLATPLYERLAKGGVGYIAIGAMTPVNTASTTPKFCGNRQIPGFCGDTIAPMGAVPYNWTLTVAEKAKKRVSIPVATEKINILCDDVAMAVSSKKNSFDVMGGTVPVCYADDGSSERTANIASVIHTAYNAANNS